LVPKRRQKWCANRADDGRAAPVRWTDLAATRHRATFGRTSGPTAHTIAMYPNNDTLGERLRLYVEENFHDA